MMSSGLVLAATLGPGATEQAEEFFSEGVGILLTSVLGSIGLLFILWSLVKAFKNFVSGMIGPAIRNVITAVIVAVFLFSPQQFGVLVDVAAVAMEQLLETFSGIVSDRTS